VNQSQKGSLLSPQIIYRTKPKLDKILATQPALNSSPKYKLKWGYGVTGFTGLRDYRVYGVIDAGLSAWGCINPWVIIIITLGL